jgi:hypothetical protein
MRTANLLTAGGFVLASVLAIGSVVAQPTPPPVFKTVVTNTPLPVTGTVGLSGPVTATLSANSTVSATVTNTATNPVPITNSDRPVPFHQAVQTVGPNPTVVQVPPGCRLVIQVVSFQTSETNPIPHLPFITVSASPSGGANTPAVFPLTTVPPPGNTVTTVGTTVIPLIVDDSFSVYDGAEPQVGIDNFSIAGYLLPLVAGTNCNPSPV